MCVIGMAPFSLEKMRLQFWEIFSNYEESILFQDFWKCRQSFQKLISWFFRNSSGFCFYLNSNNRFFCLKVFLLSSNRDLRPCQNFVKISFLLLLTYWHYFIKFLWRDAYTGPWGRSHGLYYVHTCPFTFFRPFRFPGHGIS